MSLFTDASRVTAIGALPPFTRTGAKDRSPPSPAVRHSRRGGQLQGSGAGRASPTQGGPSPESRRTFPKAKAPAARPILTLASGDPKKLMRCQCCFRVMGN
jgi:hypothetical protein